MKQSIRSWGVALLLLLGVWGVMPQHAQAAACCVSATSVGIGRLLIWEKFAVGFRSALMHGVGHWGANREWSPYTDDYSELEWRSELWTMVRLSRKASLFARLPWVLNAKRAGALEGIGGGLTDTQLGVRYELLSIGEIQYIPAVAFTFGVSAPLGRATHDAKTPLGTDITGQGAWMLSSGLAIEKTIIPWFVRLNVGVQVPLPMWRDDLAQYQRFGVQLQFALVGGVELTEGLVLSMLVRLGWEDDIRYAEEARTNSSRLDMGVALTLAWQFHPHWSVVLGADTGLFTSGFGANKPGRLSFNLGFRYGFF